MERPFWKNNQEPGGIGGRQGHRAATVCRRGHAVEKFLSAEPNADQGFCADCGAEILTKCQACDKRIRGLFDTPDALSWADYAPPKFCDCCGEPHPWATRQDRIYQLENILDQQGLDETDRLLVSESLERLRTSTDLDDKEQAKILKGIKARAPGLLAGAGGRIIEGLVSAAIRAQVGL